jgi:FkbM family methyltransferase
MIVRADSLRIGLRDRGSPGSLGDRAAFAQVFIAGEYDPLLLRINEGDAVLDAGANIGCFTLRAARRVGPRGLVIAVEPERSNVECLRSNIERNGIENVVVVTKALGGVANERVNIVGTGTMASVERMGTAAEYESAPGATSTVETTTMDDLRDMAKRSFDVVKVDIEGSEKAVFSGDGASAAVAAKAVAVEVHDADAAELVRSRFTAAGFRHVSGVKLEHEFLGRAMLGGIRRPDLALKLYGPSIASVAARIVAGGGGRSTKSESDLLGLIYAWR